MRAWSIAVRILQQLRRDKRTVVLMIVVPIVVLTLLSLIFNGSDYHPKIAVVNMPMNLIEKLEEEDASVQRMSEYEAIEAVRASEVDAVLTIDNGELDVQLEGSDPKKNSAVITLAQVVIKPAMLQHDIAISYIYGYDDMSSFDNFGPILIGLFVFFFVFLISSVAFLGERTSGTLERIMTTPVYRWEIVLGYLLGFGVVTAIQSTLVAWYAIDMLKVMMVGSFMLVLIVTILSALVALSIGMLLSAFANNELQVIQLIQITLVPQIFFSGLFDISAMPTWLQLLGRIFPLTYIVESLKSIMIRGQSWESIAGNVLILVMLCFVLFVLNVLALKKYRQI